MSVRHHQGLVGDREKLLYQVLLGHTFYSSCFWATFRLWDFGEKVVSGELGSFIFYFLFTFVPGICPVILSSDFPTPFPIYQSNI